MSAPTAADGATPGDLDPSFGQAGIALASLNSFTNASAHTIVRQPDGKLVVAGRAATLDGHRFALIRHLPDGSLDTSFGDGGRAITAVGDAGASVSRLTLQADGKIVAAGTAIVGGGRRFALARYNPDGSLDTSFGSGGTVTTAFASSWVFLRDATIAIDGKIVAGGQAGTSFAFARYGADGSLDSSFGSGGTVAIQVGTSNSSDGAAGIVLQPDGKIVSAGYSGQQFALLRLNGNGSRDLTFGTNGEVLTSVGDEYARAYAIALQPDGRILAAGSADQTEGTGSDFALVRYLPTGIPDPTFGSLGTVRTTIGYHSSVSRLVVQLDGKVLAVGGTGDGSHGNAALARYNTDGSPDVLFGSGGKTFTAVGDPPWAGAADAIVEPGGTTVAVSTAASDKGRELATLRYTATGSLGGDFAEPGGGIVYSSIGTTTQAGASESLQQPDGKLVAAGTMRIRDGGYDRMSLVLRRYHLDGSVDDGFGSGGSVAIPGPFGGQLAQQPDGKLLIGGQSAVGGNPSLFRFRGDGSPDGEFGEAGKVELPLGPWAPVADLAVQPDGKILVASDTYSEIVVLRLLSDGSYDLDFGNEGKVVTPFGDSVRASHLALQPDGKILVGASTSSGAVIARYMSDGALDGEFGDSGQVLAGSDYNQVDDLVLQPDGRMVVANRSGTTLKLRRYTPAGIPDSTFGASGKRDVGLSQGGGSPASLALDKYGRIVAATSVGSGSNSFQSAITLYRLRADGQLDSSFGSGGIAAASFASDAGSAVGGVTLQDDGRLAVAGSAVVGDDTFSTASSRFAFARFELRAPLPTVSIVSGPSAETLAREASFTFSSSSAIASFECRLDSDPWDACTSPKSYSELGLGSHTFSVRAINEEDGVGSPAQYVWTIKSAEVANPGQEKPPPNDGADEGMQPSGSLEGSSVSGQEPIPLVRDHTHDGDTVIILVKQHRGSVRIRHRGSKTFSRLNGEAEVRSGGVIDARKGEVTIDVSTGKGTLVRGRLAGALFDISVKMLHNARAIIRLRNLATRSCRVATVTSSTSSYTARRKQRRTARLSADTYGDVEVRIRKSVVVTKRRARFIIEERCRGMLVSVRKGYLVAREGSRKRRLLPGRQHLLRVR